MTNVNPTSNVYSLNHERAPVENADRPRRLPPGVVSFNDRTRLKPGDLAVICRPGDVNDGLRVRISLPISNKGMPPGDWIDWVSLDRPIAYRLATTMQFTGEYGRNGTCRRRDLRLL
jgi:hypothetical protein